MRCWVLFGVLVLTSVIGGAAAGDVPRAEAPALDGESTLREAVTTLNRDTCEAASGKVPVRFDTTELTRRALGRHHRDWTKAESAEFTRLFARRFQQWYAGVLRRGGEPRFGPATIDGNWAELQATIPRSDQEDRPVIYRLHRTTGHPWLVYDVHTNGRSRLRAFYGEFDPIIFNEGFGALVERLRTEVDGWPGCSTSPGGASRLPAAAPDRTGADRSVRPRAQ